MVRALRAPVRALVQAVAAAVVRAQRRLRPGAVTRKGFGDFVTAVDVAAERRLRAGLQRLLPDAGFLGEETPPRDLDRSWLWVVDPIDGTSNYARGLPCFSVAVALLHERSPVLACVHCQPEAALYEAVRRGGAFRNGRRLRQPAGRLDDGALLGCQW
ncbi:MAG: inositol monophosphatase family protein, partial [Planctomycetota bacterium]